MDVIIPVEITDAMVLASNLTEDDHPQWNGLTGYSIGEYAISVATHKIYRALAASGPMATEGAQDPDAEWAAIDDPLDLQNTTPIYWDRISATNKFRLFDQSPTLVTANPSSIEVTLKTGAFVQGIAFFNVFADSIQIAVSQDGAIEYDQTHPMADSSAVVDWWTYYFEPIVETQQLVITDLPPYGNAEITITISRENGGAQCGEIVLGSVFCIGRTKADPQVELLDYSKVQADEYGNLSTVVRGATQITDYEVWLPGLNTEGVFNRLKALRTKNVVWIGDDEARLNLITYGYISKLRMKVSAAFGDARANTFATIKTTGVL